MEPTQFQAADGHSMPRHRVYTLCYLAPDGWTPSQSAETREDAEIALKEWVGYGWARRELTIVASGLDPSEVAAAAAGLNRDARIASERMKTSSRGLAPRSALAPAKVRTTFRARSELR